MSAQYEPELGQMGFGQPWKERELPPDWEACLSALGALIERAHGVNPSGNHGARFDCDTFSMHSYSWTDDDQPWNFKCGDVEVSWYKWLGRGSSCNDATLKASLSEIMLACIPAIPSGKLA